jgi:hypothetical protein
MLNLSASKLNLLRECPRCFWLSLVKNVKRPSGPMSSIPIKIDSIIKGYYNQYRGEILPPILKGRVEGRLALGMPLTLSCEVFKGIVLWGRPDDYLELEDANIVVLDNKTSSKAPQTVHPSYQLQMDVYSYLLMRNGYKTIPKAYLAYFSPKESDLCEGMSMNCSVIEVCTDPNRVESLTRRALRVLNSSIPNPGHLCQYCEWTQALANFSRECKNGGCSS